MNKRFGKAQGGFTLVEIIVVLVILAILAAFTIPAMLGFVQDAREKQVYTEIREVALAAQSAYDEVYPNYKIETGASKFHGELTYYSNQSFRPQPWDKVFISKVKSLLNSDIDFNNIKVMIVNQTTLTISYSKNDKTYSYIKYPGQDPVIEETNY